MPIDALKVRGPYRGTSGYEHHVREFVRALTRLGVAVELIEFTGWGPGVRDDRHGDSSFASLARPVNAEIAVHFCLPTQVDPIPQLLNVNYTMFEASRVSSTWIEHNRRHDLVIVPTESSRRAWITSGLPSEKIRICPLGADSTLFTPSAPPVELMLPDGRSADRFKTRFLNVSEVGPRKNLAGLLRAWMLATRPDDDAALILKLSYISPGWQQYLDLEIAQLERDLGRSLNRAAPVFFVEATFSDAQMPGLFTAVTHYISMSFGEGWDLPMMEAAASNLQLIAPAHSAYLAYLTPETAHLIPSRPVPALFVGDPAHLALFAGAHWWKPDEEVAARTIRASIDGSARSKGPTREQVALRYTWERATGELLTILDEAAHPPPARARRLLPRLSRRG